MAMATVFALIPYPRDFGLRCSEHTALTVLQIKRKQGSDGNTGLNSAFLRYFIADLAQAEGWRHGRALNQNACRQTLRRTAHLYFRL